MDLLAARIARAVTGRRKILRFAGHYHGWLDPLFVDPAGERPTPEDVPIGAGQSRAAAADVLLAEWNDLDAVEAALSGGDVACVLMEPVMCNTGLIAPDPGYLESVKALCEQHGALLVIDEVITGFRFGLTGAQGMFGVTGHISVYAKAVASGFPLAVLGSTTELLAAVGRGEINHSGTYNAGVTSVAAGVATLRHLIDTDPYPEMDARTQRLADGLRAAAASASVGLAVDHIGGPVLQTRFGAAGPIRSRAAVRGRLRPGRHGGVPHGAAGVRRAAHLAPASGSSRPRMTITSSTARSKRQARRWRDSAGAPDPTFHVTGMDGEPGFPTPDAHGDRTGRPRRRDRLPDRLARTPRHGPRGALRRALEPPAARGWPGHQRELGRALARWVGRARAQRRRALERRGRRPGVSRRGERGDLAMDRRDR